ncbi:MAG: hypothetical protein QG575_194 [Euryarchaeota archaeon]|nr:hypothetical protein [Euryarchaeota archaeon]
MRHIILVLFALVALGGLLPAVMALPSTVLKDELAAMPEPAETSLMTTPSMAAFLNDSWTPSTFVAPLASQASGVQRNMTRNNTTLDSSNYEIYNFLNDNYNSSAPKSPVYTASAAGKDKTIAWTGESIYQFLNDAWAPSTPVETYPQSPFKLHQMN